MTIPFIPQQNQHEDNTHWISLSDMMTGLMMIFLLISISFIVEADNKSGHIQSVKTSLVEYEKIRLDLYNELLNEFNLDLKNWGGELEKDTLIIRFNNDSDILFKSASSEISPKFQTILNNFVPRYISLVSQNKYKKIIQELRIEGHTSSEWESERDIDAAYLKNMALSQERTRSVLKYILSMSTVKNYKSWLKECLTANGLASSKLIKIVNIENKEASRRVEFRIVTNSEMLVNQIQSKVYGSSENQLHK